MAEQLISRVITKATDSSLITLDELKEVLGIPPANTTKDAALQGTIDAVSTGICNYCDRQFVVQVYRDRFRFPCVWTYGQPLRARQFPIETDGTGDALLTVTVDGNVLDPAEYDLDIDNGRIYPIGGWGATAIVLDYTAGFDPIPADVKSAASLWAVGDWMARNRDPAIKSEAVFDVMTVVYNDLAAANTIAAAPPDAACNLLNPYRMLYA